MEKRKKMTCAALCLAAFWLAVPPARGAEFKIATWNLNWFTLRPPHDPALPADVAPRVPADFVALRGYAEKLAADVVAFEEVDGPAAAAKLFDPARYTIITIHQDVVQQVGLAVRRPIVVRQNEDLVALDVEPPGALHHLRHGLDATLIFPGGATLRLLAVHLKTGCHTDHLRHSPRHECALFARQLPLLAGWLRARAAEGAPFALLGDFNRVLDDREEFTEAVDAAAPMTRVTAGSSDPCWGGGSFIDHIFLGGPARAWLVPGSLRVLTYRSTDERDKERLSDHCPVSVKLVP
jgi:endonuclease/exonuclease/phosphatase family metal-dependent hydrolase